VWRALVHYVRRNPIERISVKQFRSQQRWAHKTDRWSDLRGRGTTGTGKPYFLDFGVPYLHFSWRIKMYNLLQSGVSRGKLKRTCIAPFNKTSPQGAHVWITQGCPCKLHHTCLYLANVRQMAQTSNYRSLLIHRPRKDERLSWPSWLTYRGRYTHISGHTSAADRAEVRKSSPVRDQRSNHWATQPINQRRSARLNYNKTVFAPPGRIIANRTWVSRLQTKSVGLCILMTGGLGHDCLACPATYCRLQPAAGAAVRSLITTGGKMNVFWVWHFCLQVFTI